MNGDPRIDAFLSCYPQYVQTQTLDQLRQSDYGRLDQSNQVYVDYTGAALYAESQVTKHFDLLRNNVFGNPHSANPSSIAMTDLVERTRRTTLDYFNANDNYHLIFTLNASGALKLIGESFPFTQGSRFLATFDNHNSVNGIREFARNRGASVDYSPLGYPDLRIDEEALLLARELGMNMQRTSTSSSDPRFAAMIRELVLERRGDILTHISLGVMGASHDVCPVDCCPPPPPRPTAR